MARRSGLGRGLGALIPTDITGEAGSALREVPVGSIAPNPHQPRSYFDEEALASLDRVDRRARACCSRSWCASWPDDRFELIAGERRWRAAKRAGLPSIPVVVRAVDEVLSLEQALVENLHREDLNPLEEAAAYQQLMEDFDLTQEQVAQKVGKSRSSVANTLRLFQLPAVDPAPGRREPARRRPRQGPARHPGPGVPGGAGQADRGRRPVGPRGRGGRARSTANPRSSPRRHPPDSPPGGAGRPGAAKRLRAAGPARARGAPGRPPRPPGWACRWPAATASGKIVDRVLGPRGPRADLPRHDRGRRPATPDRSRTCQRDRSTRLDGRASSDRRGLGASTGG